MNKEEFLKLECKHEDAYTRSKYTGDRFDGAVTYCRDCESGYTTPGDKDPYAKQPDPTPVT